MDSTPAPTGISALLRNVRSGRAPMPTRPEGRLVWLHLPEKVPADFVTALQATLEDVHLLITQKDAVPEGDLGQLLPGPRRAAIDQFIAHWKPELLLWGAAENGVAIARRATRVGMKLILADLSGQGVPASMKGRQLTEFVQYFARVLHSPGGDIDWFLKLGMNPKQAVTCGPMAEFAVPPTENEALLRRVSGALGPRPIWCAAGVSRGETGAILAAHRHAVKAIPNLLLVVVPRAAPDVIRGQIEAEGWQLSRACTEELPEKQAEVLLAENTEHLGTWMRLAPVSYMGGTLYGPEAADPFGAVAVGSAVLAGPMLSPYEARYERLKHAEAMAFIETNTALPERLVAALAPDRSAELAMQAWQVGSEGAEVIQTVAREILALLDTEVSP